MTVTRLHPTSYMFIFFIAVCFVVCSNCRDVDLGDFNFPTDHLSHYTRNYNTHCKPVFPKAEQVCHYKDFYNQKEAEKRPCWGYEDDCKEEDQYAHPTCTVHHQIWAKSIEEQKDAFFNQGDFGFIKTIKNQMLQLCVPREPGDSSLSCSENLLVCQAKNLYVDLRRLDSKRNTDRFREDILKKGDIGGHCHFDERLHKQQHEYKSPLQSWFAELEYYTSLPFKPIEDRKCDVIIDRPTILIKLDAGVSMYHHFCDFINIYASQHLNGSISTDINIIMWDTSSLEYYDFFRDTWRAFSRHPILRLDQFDGKRVCFRDAMFSLLPRRVFGLYYNMPLVPDCHGSGLFKAFSHHILHRLGLKQNKEKEIRITLLIRNTQYRNILNAKELSKAMESVPVFKLKVVDYNLNIPFPEQINITYNTDILIGIHGAGLTHLLFLPDWAVVFELYNTEDPDCYKDLANLRGVTYMTWENKDKLFQEDEGHHPTMGAHPKFTNYAFNVDEFMRIIYKAAEVVREKKKLHQNDTGVSC